LGEVIDGPFDAIKMEMIPSQCDVEEEFYHEIQPHACDLKVGRPKHIGEDSTPCQFEQISRFSWLLENNT
jgi:hypothetical protein